jgi:hypothetical protein
MRRHSFGLSLQYLYPHPTSLKSESLAPPLRVSRVDDSTGRHFPFHAFRVVDVFANGCSIPAVTSTKTSSRGHALELVIHTASLACQSQLRSCFFVCPVCVPRPAGSRFPGPFWIIWARLRNRPGFLLPLTYVNYSIMGLRSAGIDTESCIDLTLA